MVHRTRLAADEQRYFALQLLRDQIGQKVYPIHRLDRKTSGVLIFGLNKEAAAYFQKQIQERKVVKKYLAIVRGYFPEAIIVDHDLTNDSGKTQNAVTDFKLLQQTEIDLPLGKYPTSRYSLIEAMPQTGRMHQIRKHCNHLRHPIIGDRPHGCNKQNKMFKEKFQMMTMMLHAQSLEFIHPISNEKIRIEADLNTEFLRMLEILGFQS